MSPIELELQQWDPLVRGVVARFVAKLPPNVLYDDLYASGRVGLWKAFSRSQVREPGYLKMAVRSAILDELRLQDWLSRRARKQIRDTRVFGIGDLHESEWARVEPRFDPRGAMAAADARVSVERLIALLGDKREQFVLRALYIDGAPINVVAGCLGVSGPRVCQLRDRAVARLREAVLECKAIGVDLTDRKPS